MLVLLELDGVEVATMATLALERDAKGWHARLVLDDGRWFLTRDKESTNLVDGMMCDLTYFIANMLPRPGGNKFAVRYGGPGQQERGAEE